MAIEGDDGAGAAAGSAADILGGAAAAGDSGAGDQGGAGDGQSGDQSGAQGSDGQGGVDPDWYNNLSAEGGDADNPSNRDWIKALGVKDIDGLAKIARDNQRALRESGRVKVPGEGATDAERAEFHKAIGVPDAAKDYVITAPKDEAGNDMPMNTALLDRLSQSAHALGTPKAAFEGLVQDFIKYQMDEVATVDADMKSRADAVVKSWGSDAAAKIAAVDRAAAALGVSSQDMIALRNAWGPEKALETFVRMGEGMAEDVLISGGKGRFSISAAEAEAEIERLKKDVNFDPVKNPNDKARWERLQSIKAANEARKEAA